MAGPVKDVDAKFLDAVERLGRALQAARQRVATDTGLTALQTVMLERLRDRGALPVGRIAQELDVSQPTASDAVNALERKGLLQRRRSPDDGRVALIDLTEDGAARAAWIHDELRANRSGPTSPRAQARGQALEVLLQEILTLQRAGVITVNRSCLSCRHFEARTAAGPAHCHLLGVSLEPHDLRVDCPEHDS